MVTTDSVAERIWAAHAELRIVRNPTVGREEYLDFMTFKANRRPLFTEIFGPLLGLKKEWTRQGATPGELDFQSSDSGMPWMAGCRWKPVGWEALRKSSWRRPVTC